MRASVMALMTIVSIATTSLAAENASSGKLVEGKRVESGDTCGGFAGDLCPDTDYCDYDEAGMCGVGDQTGTCKPKPQACTQQYIPVCGCDGEDYGNACQAAAAGTDVAYVGTCRPGSAKKN